ncbi:MAG: tripartite tricarboxylate transporter TctB family protein [Rubrobacter sp.]|nr:tripartite tricarboxylate transporter TctB family protein [Rubrobacter sp.]
MNPARRIGSKVSLETVCGAVVLLAAAVFWSQRGYTNPLAGYFPNTILLAMAAMAVLLIVRGIVRPSSAEDDSDAEAPAEVRLGGLAKAAVLLAVWVLALWFLGYLISGIVMFCVVSLSLREGSLNLRNVLVDVVISVVVVGGVYLAFTNLIFVPLPPGPF